MWTRAELKEKAKIAYRANYWTSVLAGIIILFFTAGSGGSAGRSASSSLNNDSGEFSSAGFALFIATMIGILIVILLSVAIKIVIGNALIVGAKRIFLKNATSDSMASADNIISIFKSGFWGNVAIVMFLKNLFIFLWSLLLIIPGIIKSYEYRMVPYILAEDPSVSAGEALSRSREMMYGHKMNTFILDLSFIPWNILAALTCGILGVFYVNPYYYQTRAELYLKLKELNNGYYREI